MTAHLEFFVAGIPAPQGSKRHVGNGVMVESSAKVGPWREDVRQAATRCAAGRVFTGPTLLSLRFTMPAVASDRYRSYHTTRPDLDKLVRSTLDALVSAGVLKDDSLVFSLQASKFHAPADDESQRPGAHIEVSDMTALAKHLRDRAKERAAAQRRAS